VTSGMSDLPMSVPAGSDAPNFIELMMTVPGDWRLDHLKLRSGTDALLERFGKRGISDIVDPARPNVARKRFGLF
jgi:hypothetical protein